MDGDRCRAATVRGALTLPAPVVLVGIDAADAGLVARWADAGELPAIAALRARGLSGATTSPPALGDDGAWCSFATGVGPGRHGRRFQWHYRPGTYDWAPAPMSSVPFPSFWGALAAHGKRCVVFDVPKSPRGDVDGNVIVVDWLAHHAHGMPARVHGVGGRGATVAGLPNDGDRTSWDCAAPHTGLFDAQDLIGTLRARGEERTRGFLDVLARDDFDVAIIVMGEAHCAGHEAWHEQHVVLDAYRDVDAQVAAIVAAVGPDAIVIAFSLLGMGPNREGMYLLDAVLRRLDPVESARPLGHAGRAPRALAWARANSPAWVRRAAPPAARRVAADVRARDVSRRRYWVVPADLTATVVRCNVVGREPHGTVAPGTDFDRVCDDLRDALLELREPETGSPLVREVLRADEISPGPAPQDLGDLHVVWNGTGPLVAATSARVGDVRVALPPLRSGNHVEGGWFVAAGPGIAHRALEGPVSTLDFAPTVARLVGGHFECDGSPIPGITPPLARPGDGSPAIPCD